MEKEKYFGTLPDGREVRQYCLANDELEVRILNYGGIITDLLYRGRNIVCGFETLEDYLLDDSYQGALIGRYANRIADAAFTLNGRTYRIGANDGKNSLHGGHIGFNRHIFSVEWQGDTALRLTRRSPDGEEGYPGNLDVTATYSLQGSSLFLSFTATSDADTPVSLTNHSYFNLGGVGTSVLDYSLQVNADRYAEVDEVLTPTGAFPSVTGTDYDLRTPRRIREKAGGYDNGFMLDRGGNDCDLLHAATIKNEDLSLSVYTTQPSLQVYTACVLSGEPAFRGRVKKAPFTAICLETQDVVGGPSLGLGILKAGETYSHTTEFRILEK